MKRYQKTVVYIGPGACMPGHPDGPVLADDTQYVCVEPPSSNIWSIRAQAIYDKFSPILKKRVTLLRVDGKNTGLEQESFDESHIYNVLGDKFIKNTEKIFVEATRITRNTGAIYVGETLSPFPLATLLNLAGNEGFSPEVLINGQESELTVDQKEMIFRLIGESYRSYQHESHSLISPESYLVKFT